MSDDATWPENERRSTDHDCPFCRRAGWVDVCWYRGAVSEKDWEWHCAACGRAWWGEDPETTPIMT